MNQECRAAGRIFETKKRWFPKFRCEYYSNLVQRIQLQFVMNTQSKYFADILSIRDVLWSWIKQEA